MIKVEKRYYDPLRPGYIVYVQTITPKNDDTNVISAQVETPNGIFYYEFLAKDKDLDRWVEITGVSY